MALVNAHKVSIHGSTLNNIGGDYHYSIAAPGERGISELFKASCPDACHDSLARHPPPRCLQGTRVDTLEEIRDWIAVGDERILWLSGPAGSGKSAIAQTISEACAANFTLAASFFFFVGSPGRNTSDRFVATIVHQLAMNIDERRIQLGKAVEANLSILHKPLQAQFDKLLRSVFVSKTFDGASTVYPSTIPPQPLMIVIDGLDECKGDQNQREVIAQIGKLAADVRAPFRFLIVSRPEPQIREAFRDLSCKIHHISLGDEPHSRETHDNIYISLRHSFDEIYRMRRLTTEEFWPGDRVLRTLVRKSDGAFIYASTVIKYVRDEDYHPVKRLAEILDTPPGITPFAELDHLYCHILAAYPDTTKLLQVLTIIFLGGFNNVLSNRIQSIELLLQTEEGEVMVILRRMQSIIDISDPDKIRCHHASFSDFIMDEDRAGKFFIEMGQGYLFIAQKLMELLRTPLRHLGSSNGTQALLQYAQDNWWTGCVGSGYWNRHPQLLKDVSETLDSFPRYNPPWREALNMLDWISPGPGSGWRILPNIRRGSCDDDLRNIQLHLFRKFWEIFLGGFRNNPFHTLTVVDGTDIDYQNQFSFFCWEDHCDSAKIIGHRTEADLDLNQFIRKPENTKQYKMKVTSPIYRTSFLYRDCTVRI